jgi:hypothetical protein
MGATLVANALKFFAIDFAPQDLEEKTRELAKTSQSDTKIESIYD